jgi:hypothetical protein
VTGDRAVVRWVYRKPANHRTLEKRLNHQMPYPEGSTSTMG